MSRKRAVRGRERAGRARRFSKSEIIARTALARFTPRPKDLHKFVFLSTTGKRIPPESGRKGVFVYVSATRRGPRGGKLRKPVLKATPVREKPRAKLVPRRAGSFDLAGTRHKTAAKKYYATRRTHSTALVRLRATPRESTTTGINYHRYSERLARDLSRFSQSFRSRGSFLLELNFTISLDGRLKTYTEQLQFNQREKQLISQIGYLNFVKTSVYSFIARNLAEHGLVSAGSAAHIRSLAANRGMPREDWVDRYNNPWEKADFQTVRIVRMEYRITRVSK